MLDIETNQTVVELHIRPVVEHIQTASDIQFQRSRHLTRFRLRHTAQFIIEIAQNGHVFRHRICEIRLVDHLQSTVNDALLLCSHTGFFIQYQFAQGKDEFRFQPDGFVAIRVIEVDIERVNVVGADGRNAHHLTMKMLDFCVVFAFRIADHHIMISRQHHVSDLALGCKGFAGTGFTHNEAIWRIQP